MNPVTADIDQLARGVERVRDSRPGFGAASLRRARIVVLVAVALLALMVAGCGSSSATGSAGSGVISAIGAENEYANVLGQIGGRYVARRLDPE